MAKAGLWAGIDAEERKRGANRIRYSVVHAVNAGHCCGHPYFWVRSDRFAPLPRAWPAPKLKGIDGGPHAAEHAD